MGEKIPKFPKWEILCTFVIELNEIDIQKDHTSFYNPISRDRTVTTYMA
jgi:hypothetical protein